MPDSYARPNSKFWRDWQIVMMATKYTFSHYKPHSIAFTTNEGLKTEAKRSEKYRNKDKATKMAALTAQQSRPPKGWNPCKSFHP